MIKLLNKIPRGKQVVEIDPTTVTGIEVDGIVLSFVGGQAVMTDSEGAVMADAGGAVKMVLSSSPKKRRKSRKTSLVTLRAMSGKPVRVIAEETGISRSTISRAEQGGAENYHQLLRDYYNG